MKYIFFILVFFSSFVFYQNCKFSLNKKFKSFMELFDKVYKTQDEHKKRYNIFSKNFKHLLKQNKKINFVSEFFDLTIEEFLLLCFENKIKDKDKFKSHPKLTEKSEFLFKISQNFIKSEIEKLSKNITSEMKINEKRDIIERGIQLFKSFNVKKFEITKKYYKKMISRHENLKDPKTISEKLYWIGCFDNIPIKTKLSDKIYVCEYVKNKLGKDLCIPKIKIYKSVNDINFDELPDKFILKTNHGSDYPFYQIVRNKTKINKAKIIKKFKKALKYNYANFHYETQYYGIKPKVYSEILIGDQKADLKDYKFHCFNGKVAFIAVYGKRSTKQKYANYFFKNGTFINTYLKNEKNAPEYIDNFHNNLNTMVEYAEKIAEDFIMIRVDFYCINGTIYLGELTFTPNWGWFYFKDKEYNILFGNMLNLTEYPKNNSEYSHDNLLSIKDITNYKIPYGNFK